MEPCSAACSKGACSAIAVFKELDVSDLIPLETRQEPKGRRDFLPGHVRLIGKRAEEGDAATLLDRVGDLEVECFPEALNLRKTSGSASGPLCVPVQGMIFFSSGLSKFSET